MRHPAHRVYLRRVRCAEQHGGDTPPKVSQGSQPGAAKKVRLAIMPFENLSPDPANAFFTDGLQEEILSTLRTARARTSKCIFAYHDENPFETHPKPPSPKSQRISAPLTLSRARLVCEANNVRLYVAAH